MNSKTNNERVFITLLADECSCAIMSLTSRKEYSAMQLSHELDTPLSTVYRKLKLLEDAKIIQKVKTLIDRSGNEEKYYRCILHKATLEFREGELSIKTEKLDYKDKFVTLWKKLSKPEE
jgi:predicted transcriptional regulator